MKNLTEQAKQELLGHGIEMIILFGSRATNKNIKPDSDYDFSISTKKSENEQTFRQFSKHIELLAEKFEIEEEKIDLSYLNDADPLFLNEIMNQGFLLLGNSTKFDDLKAFARREYIATQDLRDLEKKMVLKRQDFLREKLYAK